MNIEELNELYDFKNGETMEEVMNHPLLDRDKSEWNMKEMMDDGLVKKISAMPVSTESAYEGILRVFAYFETDNDEITLQNIFKLDKSYAISEYEEQVIKGHGKFLLDIWVDGIYTFPVETRVPIIRVIMEAEENIPTGISSRFSGYYNNFVDADGNFILGNNWVLGYEFANFTKKVIGRKCIMTRKLAYEENPHINIMNSDGKLLWKNWVEIEKMMGVRYKDGHLNLEVKIPQIDHPMILDWRRFAYPHNFEEKLEKTFSAVKGNDKIKFGTFDINFFKNGRILSEREVLKILDSNEKLML